MKRIVAVALYVGLLAFLGGAVAERNGYLDWFVAPASEAALISESPRLVHYHAILAAGDASIDNFDNATLALANRLERSGVETSLLTSDPEKVTAWRDLATANGIDVLFNQMDLKPEDGCLVFITSHGSTAGLSMSADRAEHRVLTPERLAGILTRHCGNAPTVAILSGCHTGTFLIPEMEAENRIILTAARRDRTSFGCSSDYSFTRFDECLLEAMGDAGTWAAVFARTKACVEAKEGQLNMKASLPQAFFGDAVKTLGID
jgi:hypothetical protein